MINKPDEVIQLTEAMALKKYHTPWGKLAILGVLGGVYIAMGAYLSVLMGYGVPELSEANPAIGKLLAGAFFPLGLILILLVGAELFTGNTSYLIPAARRGLIPWHYILLNWLVVYVTNLLGTLLFAYFMLHLTGMMEQEPWHTAIVKIGTSKVSQPWSVVFLKGIGANWMVCLAVWLGLSSRSMLGRLVGIWLPVMAFVAMGYEHSVANMFYLPMALMSGATYSIGEAVWYNLLPSTLGNIVGGALCVGTIYSYLYSQPRAKQEEQIY